MVSSWQQVIFAFFFFYDMYSARHGKWGRVYPKLMGELYQGCLKNQDLNEGLKELRKVRKELENFSPSDVIWDAVLKFNTALGK